MLAAVGWVWHLYFLWILEPALYSSAARIDRGELRHGARDPAASRRTAATGLSASGDGGGNLQLGLLAYYKYANFLSIH